MKNEVLNSYVSFLTLNNVQPNTVASTNAYSVVLTNAANYSPGVLSTQIRLTVLADTDGDGLPDAWETDNGVQDPNLDKDGDGMTNREEYLSGTNPSDADSYLRVERFSMDGDVQVEFKAVSNLTYSVEFKNSLEELIWNKLADVAAATTNRTIILSDPSPVPNRYYRLVTPAF